MNQLEIVWLEPSQLKPYEFNNQNHSEEQVKRLADIIKKVGFRQPIIVDETYEIIAGHGRLEAAKTLGLKSVPVHVADGLSEEDKRAYRIADNKISKDASWQFDNITLELDWLEDHGFELEPWGLDELRIDGEEPEVEEDDFEGELPSETYIKRGDLIELGRHRLLCGDSTSAEDVAELMNGKQFELLFTSPPYADMRDYEGDKDLGVESLSRFLPTWAEHGNYLAVNLGLKFEGGEVVEYWQEYIDTARNHDLKFLAWNVWDKTQAGSIAHATNMFLLTHEWIFVFGSERKRLKRTVPNDLEKYEARHGKDWQKGLEGKTVRQADGSMAKTSSKTYSHHQIHSVIQQTPELGHVRKLHPATFPINLPAEYIKAFDAKIVAEPFTGSGTTLIACEQLGRICYGMELEPKYCQVIIERYKAYCEKEKKPFQCKINGELFSGEDYK